MRTEPTRAREAGSGRTAEPNRRSPGSARAKPARVPREAPSSRCLTRKGQTPIKPKASSADASNEGYMDTERPPNLRSPGTEPGSATSPGGAGIGGSPPPINALAELVADLIAATGLVPADKLALVRGAAGMGSFAHALVENNVASSEGLAKTLAARYQMPLVDLALTGVTDDASGEIALHVLDRLVAIPYALDNGTLRVAVADPGNIQGIDELRLPAPYPPPLRGASRRGHP